MDQLKELLQSLRDSAQEMAAAAKEMQTPAPEPAQQAASDPNTERFPGAAEAAAKRVAELAASGAQPTEIRELERQEKVHGPGLLFGRIWRATACAHRDKDFSREGPMRVLANRYNDRTTANMMERAMSVGTPSEGGFAVPDVLSDQWIPLLYPVSVLLRLGARIVPMPEGNMRIPRVASGATFSYGKENAKIKGSKPKLGEVKFAAKKLRGVIAISNDLLRVQSAMADAIVRDDGIRGMAVAFDKAGLVSTGTEEEPLGALKDPDATAVSIAGVVTGDVPTKFVTALVNENVDPDGPGKFGWAFNATVWEQLYNLKTTTGAYHFREEMSQGKLLNFPFGRTTRIPNGSDANKKTTVGLGDWSEYWIARQGELEIVATTDGSYYDENGDIQAPFGLDQTALRFIDKHDMRMRQAAAMAVSSDVHTVA